MMNQLPVKRCQHCGGEDIRVGWQSDALQVSDLRQLRCHPVPVRSGAAPLPTGEVKSMYDYMKALQRQFETDSRLIRI